MASTELRQPTWIRITFGAVALALGVGLGFIAPSIARGLMSLLQRTPFPTPGLLDVAASMTLIWSVPAGALLGLIGGGILIHSMAHEGLQLNVADDHLEYRQLGSEGWIEASDVAGAHRHGKYVVFLDHQARVLARLDAESLDFDELSSALQEHGYIWENQDPFEDAYQHWIDGRPGYSESEHRLVRRWKEARTKQLERMAVDEELRAAGLVVRERDSRVEIRRGRELTRGEKA